VTPSVQGLIVLVQYPLDYFTPQIQRLLSSGVNVERSQRNTETRTFCLAKLLSRQHCRAAHAHAHPVTCMHFVDYTHVPTTSSLHKTTEYIAIIMLFFFPADRGRGCRARVNLPEALYVRDQHAGPLPFHRTGSPDPRICTWLL